MSQRPGHDGLARHQPEQEGQAERELRPRADGAVQPRHRQLHREGHPRGRPGLHRLGDRGRQGASSTPSSTTTARRPSSARPASSRATTSSASAWSRSRPRTSSSASCFRFLVSETIPADAGTARAAGRRSSARAITTSAPWSRRCCARTCSSRRRRIARRIKSPVDFALGIVRGLEGKIGTTALAATLEELGQNVFYPPSVKGWDGGPAWLNGQTLLFRQNLALALTSTEDDRFGRRTDPAALARKHGKNGDAELVDFFLQLFLQGDVPAESRDAAGGVPAAVARSRRARSTGPTEDAADHRVRALCHLVLTLPEFQLD